MNMSGLASLAGVISEQMAHLEAALDVSTAPNHAQPNGSYSQTDRNNASLNDLTAGDASTLAAVREVQRNIDRLLFLYACTSHFASQLSLSEAITRLMDTLWQRDQFAFAALVLGESELGPYYYQELRGVIDTRRYHKKQCPLPLWGELAHALVRRLDPEEPDYLIIDDIAAAGRPTPEEFPWMPHNGSLIILPLRKENVAIGALILGRPMIDGFAELEPRLELVEFAAIAARTVVGAQLQEELHERAGQLVGLQLFTRSIATPDSFHGLLASVIEGINELMGAASILFAFHRALVSPPLLQLLQETPGARTYQNLIGIGIVASDEPLVLFAKLYRLLLWTLDAGQPLFFDPALPIESPEDLYYNEAGRALTVPIMIGDSPLGVLYIEAPPSLPGYDEGDMVVLRTATNAIAIALQPID